ncbi:MAG TPA: DUF4197 domain-containing protein [bacterium]|nr:DUF4197 domain-containing protein [bacterium]
MKKRLAVLLFAVCLTTWSVPPASAIDWGAIEKGAEEILKGRGRLSNEQVIDGLKEALSIGSKHAAGLASKVNGFYKNPRIKIPFPPDAQKVKDFAEKVGLQDQVEKFVTTLNRAAEEAAKEAAPVFLDAVKSLTIKDGFEILNGPNDAATSYLKSKTSGPLKTKFMPIVRRAVDTVQLTKYWKPLVSKYNLVPGVAPVNPDLDAYVTEKAISGLFKLVASEEKKIRTNPAARVTDLLKKVFGSVDKKA